MRGCKQCPAFGKCTVTYRGSACAALRSTYGEENDPEIITNADHIRSMTDEELARFLSDFKDCAGECLVGKGVTDCNGLCATKDTILNWLQQPYKEG